MAKGNEAAYDRAAVNIDEQALDRILHADSDEAGHAFQYEAGHRFRSEAGHRSDLKPATQRSLPRIEAMMFRLGGLVKRTWISGLRRSRRDGRVVKDGWVAVGNGGRSAPSTAP